MSSVFTSPHQGMGTEGAEGGDSRIRTFLTSKFTDQVPINADKGSDSRILAYLISKCSGRVTLNADKGGDSRIRTFFISKFTGKVPINADNSQPKPEDATIAHEPAVSTYLEGENSQVLLNQDVPTVVEGPHLQATSFPSTTRGSSCEFALVIPSYNNEKYYEENLNSACWQNSTNPYHIYYINDCSTDATGKRVEEYVQTNGLEDRFTLINNPISLGSGANIYNTIHTYLADHKIVVILDGDDLFPHNNVLLTLEDYYKDPDLWMTYSIPKTFPDTLRMGQKIPYKIIKKNQIRKKVALSGLRTFKAALYKKIKKEDFYYKGAFMKGTWDLAFMLPMLEMSTPKKGKGKNHQAFTKEVLYHYRVNDFRIRAKLQGKADRYVRTLKAYQPLDELLP